MDEPIVVLNDGETYTNLTGRCVLVQMENGGWKSVVLKHVLRDWIHYAKYCGNELTEREETILEDVSNG